MKDITLSEFLSIIHNNEIDKIEKIERQYNIDVYCDLGLWYGDKITIDYNLNVNNEEEEEEEYKYEIFERYNYLSKHPTKETNEERNLLLDVIVNNNYLTEYSELYPNDFGL